METMSVNKSPRTVESVSVLILGASDATNSELVDHALESAGETRDSIFGYKVHRTYNLATVMLHRS